jgi:hypothetical protein
MYLWSLKSDNRKNKRILGEQIRQSNRCKTLEPSLLPDVEQLSRIPNLIIPFFQLSAVDRFLELGRILESSRS